MNAKKKIFLSLFIGAAAIVLAAGIFALTFDINSYKPRIEALASEATGLEVRIKGKMNLSFLPFGVSVRDLRVAGKGAEIVSLESLRLGAELMPLLKKQLKVTSCELFKPSITIVKDSAGKYNFETTKKEPAKSRPGAAFSVNDFKLSKGVLVYVDKKTGEKTEVKDFNLASRDLLITDTSGEITKNISLTGSLDCREVRRKELKIDNLRSPVKMEKGVVYLKPFTADIFGAKVEGDATADKSKADAVYKINLKMSMLDFEKLEESFGAKKVIGGKGNLNASLIIKEKVGRNLISGMDGVFSLRGDNLVIYTMDLDKALSSFESSQKFNLVDVGAFLVGGPLGSVALKGYRYGDVYHQTHAGKGVITKLVSDWKISEGVADAGDCALATRHNRVALQGKLNLVTERYEKVTVVLLDDKGCAKFKQGISGPFGSPQIGAVSAVGSLAAPIFDLFGKVKRFVQGGKCEVLYRGSVQQPPK